MMVVMMVYVANFVLVIVEVIDLAIVLFYVADFILVLVVNDYVIQGFSLSFQSNY